MTSNTFNVSFARLRERPEAGRSILTWSVSLREQPASLRLYSLKKKNRAI